MTLPSAYSLLDNPNPNRYATSSYESRVMLRSLCAQPGSVIAISQQRRKDRSISMSMNIFRLCGDMSHVFSIIVLLLRLRVAKNAQGERQKLYGSSSPTSHSYCEPLKRWRPGDCRLV